MGFTFAVFKKELQLRRRDPFAFFLWLLIPLVIGGLITSISGGGGGPQPVASLLIADNDNTFVSGLVNTVFQQDQFTGLIIAETVTEEEGRTRMGDGGASALLIIPRGFGDAVINDTPIALELLANPSQRILPKIAEETLGLLIHIPFYAQRIFGPEIREIAAATGADAPPGNTTVAALSTGINEKITKMGGYIFPPVIAVKIAEPESAEKTTPGPSFALLFFPGILLMTLMFFTQGMSDSFWQEREQRTLTRIATAPRPLWQMMLGKLLAVATLSGIAVGVLYIPGFAYHGLSPALAPLSLLFCMISGAALFLIMSLIQLFSPSRRAGSLISFLLIFPLMMLGGSFFPTEAMPGWMAVIGKLTPNGYMVEVLKGYFIGNTGAAAILTATAIFAAIALLLMVIAGWRLDRHFARAA